MPIIKKKKKKIIKSSASKKQRRGLKNFDIGFIKNPYLEAAKVKDWNELEKFMSIHAAALGPAGVAYASVKFVMDNYDEMKICYECEDAVLDLIDATKIKSEFGWVPLETFETGLTKTVQWYLDNRNWWEPILNKQYQGERLGGSAN